MDTERAFEPARSDVLTVKITLAEAKDLLDALDLFSGDRFPIISAFRRFLRAKLRSTGVPV